MAAAGLLVSGPGRAEAHGVQVASEPAPNAQLSETPDLITVTFSEPIEPSVSSIELWDQAAQPVALGELVSGDDPKQMGVRVPGDLPSGIYTVVWRNLSTVDGHTWAGSYPFIILGPGGALPSGEVSGALQDIIQAPSSRPATLESAARWVVLLGSAVMLGGAAYVLFVAFPAARVLGEETADKLRRLSLTVLLVTSALGIFFVLQGSLLQLLIQADRLGGIGEADDLLIDTRLGHYLVARQGLLLVALLGLVAASRSRGRTVMPAIGLLLIASFGVLLTQSLVSHGAASHGPFWTTSIDLLHLFAASLWIGMLVHIGLAMPRWLDELSGAGRTLFAADSFRRFSGVAAVSVVVLLASGVLSALVQVTTFSDLWETTYGRSLLGKLGAMLPLLGVAGLNAFLLRPRVIEAAQHLAGGASGESGVAAPVARLQRLLANTVRAEAALGVAVLISVAALIQLQPPRAGAEAAAQSAGPLIPAPSDTEDEVFRESAEVEGLILSLVIDPARVGQNSFELGMGAEFGGIGEVLDARLDFAPPNAGAGSSRLPLALAGSAKYTAEGANLSLPGDWTVTANVRRRGEDDVRQSFTVPVAEAGPAPGEGPEPGAAAADESDSIWDWPFEGGRSAAAIAVLAVVGAGGAGYGALRIARRRA